MQSISYVVCVCSKCACFAFENHDLLFRAMDGWKVITELQIRYVF